MRKALGVLLALAACAPTPLGSAPYYPYDLDDFPVFASPAGVPLYGKRRYEERHWTAVGRQGVGGVSFYLSLELGSFPRPPFPDPIGSCRLAQQDERPASEVRLVLLQAPPGFGVSLERAAYRLQCGRFERDAWGRERLRYRTWLEVLYRFEIPQADPGVYTLRWQLWQGQALLVEEDRRFTLTAGR
ncbi:hypothetical protein DV704_00710 [Meiothermus sp. QL-1]|uniref:hypothetical protein n=1 Tax=Meiothermus sp. QL-1 TaxID=2058095 RepID=UPI000E0A76ED|nr:hypothetical protein [Meiothermus sp. QL-1]RDI96378.1 hypothetical protein DV704_00710 [Meiothermus sp. QL-1]